MLVVFISDWHEPFYSKRFLLQGVYLTLPGLNGVQPPDCLASPDEGQNFKQGNVRFERKADIVNALCEHRRANSLTRPLTVSLSAKSACGRLSPPPRHRQSVLS